MGLAVETNTSQKSQPSGLRVSTFDIDATPPVGSLLAYDPVVNVWDMDFRARGIVLLGADGLVRATRFYRQLALPKAQQVHFNGAGGTSQPGK